MIEHEFILSADAPPYCVCRLPRNNRHHLRRVTPREAAWQLTFAGLAPAPTEPAAESWREALAQQAAALIDSNPDLADRAITAVFEPQDLTAWDCPQP